MRTFKELINGFKDSNKIAIIDRKEYRKFTYSYKDLYNLSRKFASFLRENNVKKGDKIIVWNYNGIEYATIFLGAFLEGVIVVPIDLKSNIDLIKKIQQQINAKLIFQTRYKPRSKIKTIFTEQLMDLLDETEIKGDVVNINENDIVELLYTSGTTGDPKGVILTNKNIISNVEALNKVERVKSRFRFLSVLPLSHVFEQTIGLFTPLYNKATVVYIKTIKSSTLFEAFKEEKITNTAMVPRLLQLIYSGVLQKVREKNKEKLFFSLLNLNKKLPFALRKYLFKKIHTKLGNHIHYFISGGATLDPELERFYDAIGIKVLQGYGLTETSPVLTTNSIKHKKFGSVGKILPGVELKIDENKEVLAKGPSMTQGYYKNPKKTRELFNRGWLRTGDLGYFDEEKFLFLKGRKKDMIVTAAGINVYPEDIEAVLNKKEGVIDSCIVGIETKQGEDIHAVLLLKKDANTRKIITESNKKLDSSQQINNYSVWPHEDFPRTTTLKVKKFVVKELIQKKTQPKTIKGKNRVYDILAHLTKKKITKDSRLRDLGISSIDRLELISLLEQEFRIEIDEENILPTTKIKDLEKIVKIKKTIEEKPLFKRWSLSTPTNILRGIVQRILLFPFVGLFSWPSVEGKENLRGIKGPVIFTSNHQSHFDTPLILVKLPFRFSLKIATAAWQEYFFKSNLKFKSFKSRILFYLITLFFNIYPFPQEKGFRKSIKYTGKLISNRWNILIYPEGERTRTGEMNRFKQGIGMLAVEMKVPIIPIRIENTIKILPKWKRWPTFGRVKLKIGKPIFIKQDSYIKSTEIIEKAVTAL